MLKTSNLQDSISFKSSMLGMTSQKAYERAIYSASVVLRATMVWNLEAHATGHPAKKMYHSDLDLTTTGSSSECSLLKAPAKSASAFCDWLETYSSVLKIRLGASQSIAHATQSIQVVYWNIWIQYSYLTKRMSHSDTFRNMWVWESKELEHKYSNICQSVLSQQKP